MKVAFFTPTRERCGIADYARLLLAHLHRDVEVQVVAAERAAARDDYAALGRAMNDADVAHVQYEHGFFLLGDRPAENFDVFAGAIRVPTLLTLHCPPLADPAWQRHLDDPKMSCLVHTRELACAVRAHSARCRVESVLHPAPPRPRRTTSRARFRATHQLDGRRVLAIFGFTKAHKGYDLALDALRHLPADTVLLIAGGPQDERDRESLAEVLRRADRLGIGERVRVTGFLRPDDVGAALRASDVVLAPFRASHASGSVATALTWERPVIAAALDPFAELEQEAGCLRLFTPGDAEDLARQVELVLGEPWVRRALVAGARRYRESHGYGSLASRVHTLYERIAAGSDAAESL